MSSYNLNMENSNSLGILQSDNGSVDRSHEILSPTADIQAASKFKEVHETEVLKSDLADASNKLAWQYVAILDLKNDLHAAFNSKCLLEAVTAKQAQELEIRTWKI